MNGIYRHGVDTDGWGAGPDGCSQTLLHRCIDENDERGAKFLVRAGCDINRFEHFYLFCPQKTNQKIFSSPRRPGPDGGGGEEAHDQATPLHLCCQWGLEETVAALIEHGANVNAKVSKN